MAEIPALAVSKAASVVAPVTPKVPVRVVFPTTARFFSKIEFCLLVKVPAPKEDPKTKLVVEPATPFVPKSNCFVDPDVVAPVPIPIVCPEVILEAKYKFVVLPNK